MADPRLDYIDDLHGLDEISGAVMAARLLGRTLGQEEADRLERRVKRLGGSPVSMQRAIAEIRAQAGETAK